MKETKDSFNVLIGKRIMEIRIQKHMTREQLAEHADISAKYLYEVEMGRKNCSLYIIYKLSRCLDINVDYILRDDKNIDKSNSIDDVYKRFRNDQKEQIKEIMQIIYEIIDNL